VNHRKLNISNNRSQIKKDKLVLVREGILYGLVIEKYKEETTSLNRGITSTPTFVFYDNNTKCLIDYTNQTNSEIESSIRDFFGQMESGVTFGVYNGSYTDPNLNSYADITGTYQFRGYYKGIVEAKVSTVTSLAEKINRYDRNRFEQIPYITVASLAITDNKTIIKNRFGKDTKNSFNYFGIKVGDYVRVNEMSSPAKILKMDIDSDGNEYIIIDADISTGDMTEIQTTLLVYLLVPDSYSVEPNLQEIDVGACIEYLNGVYVSCTNNHTLSQCRFRASDSKGIKTEITIGTFCNTPDTTTAVQSDTTSNLLQVTNSLANSISIMSSTSGPILKNSNLKSAFYGR